MGAQNFDFKFLKNGRFLASIVFFVFVEENRLVRRNFWTDYNSGAIALLLPSAMTLLEGLACFTVVMLSRDGIECTSQHNVC